MKHIALFFQLIFGLCLFTSGYAAVELPEVIGSHMVLQRNEQVPVWGTADPGEEVSVSFKGQLKHVTADQQGNWKVLLGPFKASFDPAEMIISGNNRLVLEDILIGEVWLCAGQSNMQWTLEQSAGGDEAIKEADYPEIRLFNVSRDVAFKRKKGKLASWQACSPETVPDFSGVGYFFGKSLHTKLNTPIGLINASYGGSQAEAWTPREYLAASKDLQPCIEREKIWEQERPQVKNDYERQIREWEQAAKEAEAKGTKAPRRPRVPDALRDYRIAASIYQGMIEPLIPFYIRGALWYQGESNEERAEQYELLLSTMIRSWRENWDQGNFPFAIVQLPNFRGVEDQPSDHAWSRLRDAQRQTFMKDPNTGLIVTTDIGEADDIHPTNKLDVGNRLCRWALADVYGQKITKSGPVYQKIKFSGNKAVISFSETGQGLQSCKGEALQEFAIAGADKKWYWAKAEIKGKKKVVVWSDQVPEPVAVRYAFNNNPANPNLSNETCIPATPFRTDMWPGPTAGKR